MIYLYITTARSPYWFDWLSLILTVVVTGGSVVGAYCISQKTFNKEKKLREDVEKKSREAEVKLFKNNLKQLGDAIGRQIDSLVECLKTLNPIDNLILKRTINVEFLKFIQVRQLFLGIDFNEGKINKLNRLMEILYPMSGLIPEQQKEILERQKILISSIIELKKIEIEILSVKLIDFKTIMEDCDEEFSEKFHSIISYKRDENLHTILETSIETHETIVSKHIIAPLSDLLASAPKHQITSRLFYLIENYKSNYDMIDGIKTMNRAGITNYKKKLEYMNEKITAFLADWDSFFNLENKT